MITNYNATFEDEIAQRCEKCKYFNQKDKACYYDAIFDEPCPDDNPDPIFNF